MIIYKNPKSYSAMPDVLKVENNIYIVFREAKRRRIGTHIDPSSHVGIIRVIDGMASYEWISGTDGANDPSINFIDGKFYLNYFTWKTGIFALCPWFTKLEGITVLMSEHGDFWERIELEGTEGFATSAKIVKFKDKLLLPAYDTKEERDRAVILISDDDFETFTYSYIPRGDYIHYQEPVLLRLEDKMLAVMRTSKGFLYQSIFDGKEWSISEETNMFGWPADLIKVGDNIVCVYGNRLGGEIGYAVNHGDISPSRWEAYHITDVESFDSGYPSVIDLGERLFCVYYDHDNGITCIKGVYFP